MSPSRALPASQSPKSSSGKERGEQRHLDKGQLKGGEEKEWGEGSRRLCLPGSGTMQVDWTRGSLVLTH